MTAFLRGNRKWMAAAALAVLAAATISITLWLRSSFEGEAARLADLLELRPGMVVGELGAGKGEMTVRMAARVGPSGHVYANELNPDRLQDIREAVAAAGLDNVTVVEGSEDSGNLPEGCCDAIFMRRVYHHISEPAPINASLSRALRPGGKLAVIDFAPEDAVFYVRWFDANPEGIPQDRGGHGVPPRIVIREMEQAGFAPEQVIQDWTLSPWNHHFCVLFRR